MQASGFEFIRVVSTAAELGNCILVPSLYLLLALLDGLIISFLGRTRVGGGGGGWLVERVSGKHLWTLTHHVSTANHAWRPGH